MSEERPMAAPPVGSQSVYRFSVTGDNPLYHEKLRCCPAIDRPSSPTVLIQGESGFKFRFVFFRLQMLRFSALCGPNEQKFSELLT